MTELAIRDNEPTPMGLLAAALEANVDADRLEKLLDLQERWDRKAAEKAYAVSMRSAQAEMPVVVRDAKNDQTNSRYTRLETLARAIDPVIHRNGFSICFGTEDCPIEGHYRITAEVIHEAGHARKYQLDLPSDGLGIKGNANKTGTHAAGSTMSYGRRYLKLMIFDVTVAGEDNDGNTVPVIDGEQQAFIYRLMAEREVDVERFWAWAGVKRVEDLPLDKFASAKDMLLAKPRKGTENATN